MEVVEICRHKVVVAEIYKRMEGVVTVKVVVVIYTNMVVEENCTSREVGCGKILVGLVTSSKKKKVVVKYDHHKACNCQKLH